MPAVFTIGVYEADAESFLAALREVQIETLYDVRQRRGVRGSRYSWANAQRLMAALTEAGIGYRHHRELAPTTELRQLQYREDDRRGEGKRSRTVLAPEYVEGYVREILDHSDFENFADLVEREGPVALLCVERDPEACHRSLIADRLRERRGMTVTHLRP